MGIIEDITKMKQQGKQQSEMLDFLKQRGFSDQDASNIISQAQIKEAITSPSPAPEEAPAEETANINRPLEYQIPSFGMRPATEELGSPQAPLQAPLPQEQQYQEYQEITPASQEESYQQEMQPPQQDYTQYPTDYSQYQQYASPQISSDTITEIAEQIVTEKLARIRDRLEKIIDLKTVLETKLLNLDDRLQRIEKIIDRLQLSILQKVGEYVINVSDLKKELMETQKSFKSISHHPSHAEHSAPHHIAHATHSHSKTKHRP